MTCRTAALEAECIGSSGNSFKRIRCTSAVCIKLGHISAVCTIDVDLCQRVRRVKRIGTGFLCGKHIEEFAVEIIPVLHSRGTDREVERIILRTLCSLGHCKDYS